MSSIVIKSATIVNENKQYVSDLLVKDGLIDRIDRNIDVHADQTINAEGLHLFPGCIDDQVHFREPGLTHKADIHSESRAAVAGGITGAFTAEHAATRTGCGDRVFRRRELAVFASPHSRSEERASDRPPTGGPGRHGGKMITYSAPSSFVSSSSNHALR